MFSDMNGVHFFDAGSVAEISLEDCIHLSTKGHQALAHAIYKKVVEILGI